MKTFLQEAIDGIFLNPDEEQEELKAISNLELEIEIEEQEEELANITYFGGTE